MKSVALGDIYTESTGMDSLRSRYESLSKLVSGVRRQDVIHIIGGFYCGVSVLYGSPHIHRSNGGYIAKTEDEKTVYVSCPYCVYDPSCATKNPLADILQGTEKTKHPWVRYTEEVYQAIARIAESREGAATTKKAKITKK